MAAAKLNTQDRAFARAVVMATLRHLGPIDRALDGRLAKDPAGRVRNLLRIGVAQAFWLDTPDFAAVDTTVALAPARSDARLQGPGQRRAARPAARRPPSWPTRTSSRRRWLLARWRAAFGEADALAIVGQIPAEPATDLTPRDPADTALAGELDAILLPGGSLRTAKRGEIAAWPGFAEGRWWVQDAAAAIPARLLAIQPGDTRPRSLRRARAARPCSWPPPAPPSPPWTAPPRACARLADGLARTGLAAEVVTADAGDLGRPAHLRRGAARRPLQRHRHVPPQPRRALERQARPTSPGRRGAVAGLLDAAAQRVRPGGRLVYSVCSLETEEGEAQATAFLKRHPEFATLPAAPGEGGAPAASVTPGWLAAHPAAPPGRRHRRVFHRPLPPRSG